MNAAREILLRRLGQYGVFGAKGEADGLPENGEVG
jgi:hypothetical protein